MGASNFHNKNARNVYSVLMNYEEEILDEDGNETGETQTVSCESWDWDNIIEHLGELMNESTLFNTSDRVLFSDLRSYEGTGIKSFVSCRTFGDFEVEILLTAIVRTGYYEGANLDWELNYYTGSDYDNCIDFRYDIETYSDMSKGLQAIQLKHSKNWAKEEGEKMVQELERIFKQVSQPLEVVARFSNGETIYKEVG